MTEADENPPPVQPAGWYPDRADPHLLRYWDGSKWTAAAMPMLSSSQSRTEELRHRRRATMLIVLGVLSVLLAVMAIVSLRLVAAPILRDQAAKAADTQAQLDVTALGRDIAFYYTDHTGAPPQITVIGGEYHIAGALPPFDVETVGEGVALGAVTGTSPTNWCVWVTHPDGEFQDYRYSAIDGLEQGRC